MPAIIHNYQFCARTILSYQFEEEIGAASSDNGLFIAKMKFSVRTPGSYSYGSDDQVVYC
jgi:hypothetical protein